MCRVAFFQNEVSEQSEGAENLNVLGNSVWRTDHPQHTGHVCKCFHHQYYNVQYTCAAFGSCLVPRIFGNANGQLKSPASLNMVVCSAYLEASWPQTSGLKGNNAICVMRVTELLRQGGDLCQKMLLPSS